MMTEKQFNAVIKQELPDLDKYRVFQICEERSRTCHGSIVLDKATGKQVTVKWDPLTLTPEIIRAKFREALKALQDVPGAMAIQ